MLGQDSQELADLLLRLKQYFPRLNWQLNDARADITGTGYIFEIEAVSWAHDGWNWRIRLSYNTVSFRGLIRLLQDHEQCWNTSFTDLEEALTLLQVELVNIARATLQLLKGTTSGKAINKI